ncbi:MAG: type IX secretion system membrane protein PorP/SprF, partial [Saprospiraceae bacterium]|nr:type IX secretion system membrane protein PorP/SprF [Saprospiraceae bacterium]
ANQPLISFLDNSESQPLNLRWSAHMGGEVPLSRNFSILPAAVYTQQGQATSFTAGGNARFSNWNRLELNLRAGPWLHFSNRLEEALQLEAIIVAVIFELERVNVGVSYDVTTSSLNRSNYARGAFELSGTYLFKPRGRKYEVQCPNF